MVLKKSQHRYMERRVYCIGDICIQNNDGTYRLMNIREMREKHGEAPMPECVRLISSVKTALVRHQIDTSKFNFVYPYRPALLDLLFISKKGCSGWTKLTKRGFNQKSKVALREQKWDEKLGGYRGVDFWDSLY